MCMVVGMLLGSKCVIRVQLLSLSRLTTLCSWRDRLMETRARARPDRVQPRFTPHCALGATDLWKRESLGFGPNFRKWTGMLYDKEHRPARRIKQNGELGEVFYIRSGVAQGCPLSPLLFLRTRQRAHFFVER